MGLLAYCGWTAEQAPFSYRRPGRAKASFPLHDPDEQSRATHDSTPQAAWQPM